MSTNISTTPVQIVAFTGLAGSGKDTAADVLVTHAGFTKLAFADPLRAEVAEAFSLRTDEFDLLTRRDTKDLPTSRLALCECQQLGCISAVARATAATVDDAWLHAPRSPRTILQWWGTEYRRAQQANYWSTKMAIRIGHLSEMGQRRFVIADCRFQNEAAAVRRMGGYIWQVTRVAAAQAALEGGHSSTNDGSDFMPTVSLRNNGGVLDLRTQVLHHWWSLEAGVDIERLEIAA